MTANRTVQAAIAGAWGASNVAVNPPVADQHEEGGWVYLNLLTNELSTRRQAAGAQAAIDLSAPPVQADSVVVGKFHTHPNLGPVWLATASPKDIKVDAEHGVPDIVVATTGINPAVFTTFPSGPDRRLHLAGDQGLPGLAGGLAPQAKADGTEDDG
jgi:proteasome lid subunit RPN8/RPN11